jgi:RNA polymerase sigma-70 factor (ECF subfamily)
LWSYLHRVSGDAALADDILQETYYRFLCSSLAAPDEARMKSYLYKIATNLLKDHWRKQKREQRRALEGNPEQATTVDGAQAHKVEQALEALNLQERTLLWLAYVEGNRHSEIAQSLGLKEKSIRVLLFRARRKLANMLRQEDSSVEG